MKIRSRCLGRPSRGACPLESTPHLVPVTQLSASLVSLPTAPSPSPWLAACSVIASEAPGPAPGPRVTPGDPIYSYMAWALTYPQETDLVLKIVHI